VNPTEKINMTGAVPHIGQNIPWPQHAIHPVVQLHPIRLDLAIVTAPPWMCTAPKVKQWTMGLYMLTFQIPK
jgi:hypothetical protein